MELIQKELIVDVKEYNVEEGTIRAIFSSGMPDRQGEMIDQSSWNLDEFKKNPVVLWSHNATELPIGRVENIGINSDGMLEGIVRFAIKEYDFAKTIFQLYVGRFIRAFSVGFTSNQVEEINGIRVLKDNVLYEISGVALPADALALAKQKGIDITPLDSKKKNKPKIPDTEKSPACRMTNESKEECVSRKIPEILEENPDMKQDQAVAIANALCSKKCSSKGCEIEKEGRVLSAKNRSIIEKAKVALEEVLKADTSKPEREPKKLKIRKILNRAIRELLEAKKIK